MYDELIPVIGNSMLATVGSVPVVFEGIQHILEHKTKTPKSSSHTSHELIHVRSGKVALTIDGKTITIDKGTTVIIRPNVQHSISIPSGTSDVFVLYFAFAKDEADVNKMVDMASTEEQRKADFGPLFKLREGMDQTSFESFLDFVSGSDRDDLTKTSHLIIYGSYKKSIGSIVERIVEEQKSHQYSKEAMMQILTLELMITLSRAMKKEWEESLRVRNGKARELVLIARDYIDQNYDRGITISDVASYVFLSQGYFTRAFREEVGISPMQYLMEIRIKKACELLADNDIKVSSIAHQTGFASAQRFNVAFRNHMEMTPLEYRKSIE